MQAFAETYADMAIDAALGDSEAAKNLFSKDTFLTALESGLSGGASRRVGRRSRHGAGKAERRRRKPAGAGEVSRPDGPDGAGCRPAEGNGRPGRQSPLSRLRRQLPQRGEPLACRAALSWTLEVLQGVRWRALRQREAAVDLRSRHWEPQPGSKAPFLKETPLKVCSGRKQLPQNRKIRRCGSLPKWRRATA